MATVIYKGKADFRTLAKADLIGVDDFSKLTFAKGVPTEVSDEAAKALLDGKALYGKFELVKEEAADLALFDAPADKKPLARK